MSAAICFNLDQSEILSSVNESNSVTIDSGSILIELSYRRSFTSYSEEFNSFPNDYFFNSSKLKEFADNNVKFNENGRKFSKRVENTVGKGEIARYEQFLLFPQCFRRLVWQTRKTQACF